jgi:hypothetical protein
MIRSITALAAAGAIAVAAFAVPAGAANTQLRVYVSNCQKQVYKPKTITVFCADDGVFIKKIKYSAYTAKIARGKGTAVVNLCVPNCAAGKLKNYAVRLTLSKVSQCGDSFQFHDLSMTYVGAKPKGDRTIKETYDCATAPTR